MDAKAVARAPGSGARVPAPAGALRRRRPRSYEEWKTLSSWGALPAWEIRVPGYELRRAREAAGLTQDGLALRLGVSQQAIARAERWASNPTIRFVESWTEAIGGDLRFAIELAVRPSRRGLPASDDRSRVIGQP